ncbi:class I SAM-dependent methyltransferase [candidate division KSB1 bacterium]|nr:class I SAM-dependent methyltransferase [candidate division KSB1 bacterium]
MDNPVSQLFDKWAQDYHADGMEIEHWPTVKQAIELLPPVQGNYLEIGMGNGYAIQYFAETGFDNCLYYGLDISSEMVLKVEAGLKHLENIHLVHADFLEWQPPENTQFDLIFSMEVFYYFSDIQAGMDKAASMINPGGLLMILVNYYMGNPESHDWPKELGVPMQLWSEEQYREGFVKTGLQNIRQQHLKHPDHPDEPGTLVTWARK